MLLFKLIVKVLDKNGKLSHALCTFITMQAPHFENHVYAHALTITLPSHLSKKSTKKIKVASSHFRDCGRSKVS